MFVYLMQNEGQGHYIYTVGFYDPSGIWQSDSDHATREKAAERVNYLNGGKAISSPTD